MDHTLDDIEPSLGMDASFAESSISDLSHTYLGEYFHKEDTTHSVGQYHMTRRLLPIADWQEEDVVQWASEALRHRGFDGASDLLPLRNVSGKQLLRLSHQYLCDLVGRRCGTILHQQIQVLQRSQGSQGMLLEEASGGSLYTNPDSLSSDPVSWHTNPDFLNSSLHSLYTSPDSLYNSESLLSNSDSLYNSDSLLSNSDSLYNSDSLLSNSDSLYNSDSLLSNSDSLYANSDSLYNPDSLLSTSDSSYTKPDPLYSNPDSLSLRSKPADPLYSNPESMSSCSGWKMAPDMLMDLQQFLPEEPWPPMTKAAPLRQEIQEPLLDTFQDLDIREQIMPVENEEPEVCSFEAGGSGRGGGGGGGGSASESGGLLIPSSDMLKKIPSKTRKRVRGPKSWEFLMRLLTDQRTNPSLIRWEDEANATFRLMQPAIVAQMWANRTNDNRNLSYNNFARGLRHHYTTGALSPVMEKQLVYQCGPTALQFLQELRGKQ